MNASPATIDAIERQAWHHSIAFFSADGAAQLRIIHGYKQRFHVADQPQAIVNEIFNATPQRFPRQNQPWNAPPQSPPPHQNPTTDRQRKACVDADLKEFVRRADNGHLHLRLKYANGTILYTPIPPLSDNDLRYNNTLLDICRIYGDEHSPLTGAVQDYYSKKFSRNVTSSVCLRKGFPAWHATSPSTYQMNGTTEGIGIVRKALAHDPTKQVNFDNVKIGDEVHPNLNNRIDLWGNNANLDQPPPHNLRNHPAISHNNPSKQTSPTPEELEDYLTPEGYDNYVVNHCCHGLHMADGGYSYLTEIARLPCIMPSTMQKPETIMANGRHFNKRAMIIGSGSNVWEDVRSTHPGNNDHDLEQRAQEYHDISEGFRTQVQSVDFRTRESYDDQDHCYAISSMTGALSFYLTHDGMIQMHYPGTDSEFCNGATIQVAANRDVKRVGAMGLDWQGNNSLKNIIRWRMPVPIVASYYVQFGPPSRPILGATWTVVDECYRPTLGTGLVSFSFV
jgi:hypothetical protein